ncbi:MAG: MoxR-like ATPase [Myxococcota bacterium]|jgi:MoxR-like ATPase
MDPTAVRPALADAIRTLRSAGIPLTDRRAVKIQSLVTAAAALAGREQTSEADLWPISYAVPDARSQATARDLLRDALAASDNPSTPAAVEAASRGPRARATRLVAAAEAPLGESDRSVPWRRRLEGVAREMDAAFLEQDRSDDLTAARERVVSALGATR